MSCQEKWKKQNKRSGSHAGNRYKCDSCEIMSFCHEQWKRRSVVMQKLVSGECTSSGAAHLGLWMISWEVSACVLLEAVLYSLFYPLLTVIFGICYTIYATFKALQMEADECVSRASVTTFFKCVVRTFLDFSFAVNFKLWWLKTRPTCNYFQVHFSPIHDKSADLFKTSHVLSRVHLITLFLRQTVYRISGMIVTGKNCGSRRKMCAGNVHQRSHMDLPRIEPGLPRWEAGD
jgi:hypothetical protein